MPKTAQGQGGQLKLPGFQPTKCAGYGNAAQICDGYLAASCSSLQVNCPAFETVNHFGVPDPALRLQRTNINGDLSPRLDGNVSTSVDVVGNKDVSSLTLLLFGDKGCVRKYNSPIDIC